jgi:ABC-type nickel/cobalt efflux system permease component RcnA
VVLLSALSLHRVEYGLLLIVAFSAGLAGVLIGIGVLMVVARRFAARIPSNGPLIARWLPLASALVITLLGVGMTAQAILTAGLLGARPG